MLDVTFLSRLQFAFTMGFHIIFPAFSIGIASFLVVMEGLWLSTRQPIYYQIIRFWTKIFGLTFGMGVVAGIVMEFQLGTNWAGFAQLVGSVLGPLFIFEVLTAFFIEAGFIGIMLFGWNKVSPRLHYLATIMVTLGTTLSAYWIVAANSWMQNPVGYNFHGGKLVVTNWLAIIGNSYNLPRFLHMLLAAYLCASFVIISVSAYYLLHNQFINFAKTCLRAAVKVVIIIIPLQIAVGDISGLNVFARQPLKTAAMEGVWYTQAGAPLLLLAAPSQQQQRNLFEVGIPYAASLLNTHSLKGVIPGLTTVTPDEQPTVWLVFYSFRIMVALGLIMLVYAFVAGYLLYRNRLFQHKLLLRISRYMAPSGFIALVTGWLTAEIGRQPWAIYGILKINDAASIIPLTNVIISFTLIIVVYGIIFGYVYFYFLNKTIKKGPADLELLQPFSYLSSNQPLELRDTP